MAARIPERPSGAAPASLTPGQHLRSEMQRLGLDQGALGEAIGVSRQSINNVVTDRLPISRAMAARLGRVTGHASDYWLQKTFPVHVSGVRPGRPTGVLVRQQIVNAVEDGVIGIAPFDRARVRLASIDLTLHGGVTLEREQLVAARTREHIDLPIDYLARLGGAEHISSRGVFVLHAPQVEPTFSGPIQFALLNAGGADVHLGDGDVVINLEIVALAAVPMSDPKRRPQRGPRTPGARASRVK